MGGVLGDDAWLKHLLYIDKSGRSSLQNSRLIWTEMLSPPSDKVSGKNEWMY